MSDTAVNLLLALFLLAANAFFVAAEFALVKSKGFRIDNLAKEETFGAELTQRMLMHVEAYLACCQLGITMASLGLGWVGEPTVSALLTPILVPLGMPQGALHVTSFLVGFLVFSALHIVLGEQVPKTLAIRQPEPVAMWIAYPLHATYWLLYPLNWALNNASRGVLRLLGVQEAPHTEILTDTELAGLVEVSAEHGEVEEKQAEYINNLFRFGELGVVDVMVHRTNMYSVDVDEDPAKVVDAVMSGPHTRVPIWEKDPENIIGTVHIKDAIRAVKAAGGDASKVDIRAIMAKPWFVPDTTSLNDQLSAFLKRKAHIALVVDEYGEVQGLVTLEDILEEIVGDIADEHEVTVTGVRPLPDGSINVDGSVPIRDLNRVTGWELPDDQANTIAGLVIHEARIIPEVGQAFTFHGYRFQVLRKNKNRVTALRITPLNRVKPPAAAPASNPTPAATIAP
jgi:CBS domain containing-hemolysin-like protein